MRMYGLVHFGLFPWDLCFTCSELQQTKIAYEAHFTKRYTIAVKVFNLVKKKHYGNLNKMVFFYSATVPSEW